MAKGHLSEDTINFIMTAESSQLQQEIHKSAKVIDDLKKKEADLRKEQAAVKTVLGEESKGRGKRGSGTHNLYNKLVWPILYKRVFPELKYGFTDEVRSQLREQLAKALGARG